MIIGLVGFAGSGKDTVAEYLERCKRFNVDSFANTLKDAASVIFGWDRGMLEGKTKDSREWRERPDRFWSESLGYDFTPRMALQRLGTEAGQAVFGKNVWVSSLMKRIKNYPKVVITDARFSHEISAITNAGGILVRVKRGPEPEWVKFLSQKDSPQEREDFMKILGIHKSEWDWIGCNYDYIINNDSDLSSLYEQVDVILKRS